MNTQSENLNELATALAKAQGEITSASKDKVNPFHKNHYSTLDSVWEACRAALSKNGLSVVQTMSLEGELLLMTTMLLHASGQWLKSVMPLISQKAKPQEIGSAVTYMRRYSLMALVGIAPGDDKDSKDDDGEEAQRAEAPPPIKESFITADQVNELGLLLESKILPYESGYTENFLKIYKSPSLGKLPAHMFDKAMMSLHKKVQSLQK